MALAGIVDNHFKAMQDKFNDILSNSELRPGVFFVSLQNHAVIRAIIGLENPEHQWSAKLVRLSLMEAWPWIRGGLWAHTIDRSYSTVKQVCQDALLLQYQ